MKYNYNKQELTIMESRSGKYKTKLGALKALRQDLFNDYLNHSMILDDLESSLDAVDKELKKNK